MKSSWFILFCLGWLLSFPVCAADVSEGAAMQKIKALPEFKAYAKQREFTFDDNEPITVAGAYQLPKAVGLPAWRLDVHTVVHDPVVPHTSLWARFFVSASGKVFAWDRVADRIVTLEQWRTARKQAEQGVVVKP